MSSEYLDPEADQPFGADFSEKSVRMGFIRKVYGILTAQLLVTIGIIAIFIYVEPVRNYAHKNEWMYILALVLTIVIIIILACCPNVRRQSPTNFILLGIFTLLEGYMLGAISSRFQTDAVLMAAGITAVVAVGLTIFAFQTKWDFTAMGGILFVLLIVLMVFGLLCAIIRSRYATIAYASLGALVFAGYLVFDTQMMLGGSHQYSISPEEYIFAALNLYLDIVNLFLYILVLVQGARN